MRKAFMKRSLAMAVTAMMMGALAGCASGSSSQTENAQTTAQASEAESKADGETTAEGAVSPKDGKAYKVGVIQMVENGAFNDMREGFIEELRAKGYSESDLVIDYKCAQGDATNLQTIAQGMAGGDYDFVATVPPPPTQAMVNLKTETPVIFVAVSAPQAAGVITEMEKPDKNATGTSNAIPVGDIFALSEKLTPDAKTFGLLYCTSEVNSVNTAESAKKYCEENGLEYKEAVVTNSSEVQQAAQSLADSVDAIFIPNDSVIQSAMPLVTEVARSAKIPVYGSSATMVDSGAFATIAISDKEIGAQSADMAIEYLSGTAIADIPAIVVPASETVVNKTTMEALGIEVAEEDGIRFVEDKN